MLCPNKILCKVQVRMKDRSHFCKDYCASGLLGELGVSNACHFFTFSLDSYSFLLKAIGANNLSLFQKLLPLVEANISTPF
jgi:hypothetical protein